MGSERAMYADKDAERNSMVDMGVLKLTKRNSVTTQADRDHAATRNDLKTTWANLKMV